MRKLIKVKKMKAVSKFYAQIFSVCLIAVVVGAVGCSNSSESAGGASGGSKKPKVALIMKSLANEFFSTMADGAKTYQSSHADQFDLIVNGIKDELDIARQVALVEEMAASGVSAIVIAPADSKALVPALRRAMKAGVIVINIDNKLDDELLKKEGLAIPFVGPNNKAGAEKAGDYLASKLKAEDAVAILEGLQTSENGRLRLEGFHESIKKANLKVVDSQSGEWEMSKANAVASSMLSEHPEIKAILAANDSMAIGTVAAAKSVGRDDLLIIGFDNISAVRDAIKAGKILATVNQHADQLAVFGIETALKLIADPKQAVSDVETPVEVVNAETLSK